MRGVSPVPRLVGLDGGGVLLLVVLLPSVLAVLARARYAVSASGVSIEAGGRQHLLAAAARLLAAAGEHAVLSDDGLIDPGFGRSGLARVPQPLVVHAAKLQLACRAITSCDLARQRWSSTCSASRRIQRAAGALARIVHAAQTAVRGPGKCLASRDGAWLRRFVGPGSLGSSCPAVVPGSAACSVSGRGPWRSLAGCSPGGCITASSLEHPAACRFSSSGSSVAPTMITQPSDEASQSDHTLN